jgi:hypothetical protein
MQHSVFYLLAIALVLSSCSEGGNNDLKTLGLKGAVKKMTTIKYEAVEKFGKVEKGDKVPREETGYNSMLALENAAFEFNEEKNNTSFSAFDRRGNLEFKGVWKEDTIVDLISPNGELMLKLIADDHLLPTEGNFYNASGKLEQKILIKYEDEKAVESKTYNANGDLTEIVNSEYNADGTLAKMVTTIKDNYYDRTSIVTETFEYGGKAEPIKVIKTEGEQVTTSELKYTYDEKGNWIERIEYVSGIPKYLTERTIEYY